MCNMDGDEISLWRNGGFPSDAMKTAVDMVPADRMAPWKDRCWHE